MFVSFFQESKTPFVLVCFLKITHFLHPLIRIKCSDDDVEEIYGLGYLPRLVYFEGGVPEPFVGDEQNIDEILKWIRDEMKSEEIKKVTKEILDKLKVCTEELSFMVKTLLAKETLHDSRATKAFRLQYSK